MKSTTVNDPINGTNGHNGADENDNKLFYERLPRFVPDQLTEAIGDNLSAVERNFEYDEMQFLLTIVPGKIAVYSEDDGSFESHSRLPGEFERKLEEALRQLATFENINFETEKNVLVCSFSQLRNVINWLEDEDKDDDKAKETKNSRTEVTRSRIDIGLATLCNVSYILKRGGREFYFHPFERLRQKEIESETYYKIYLSQVFFSSSLFRRFLWD